MGAFKVLILVLAIVVFAQINAWPYLDQTLGAVVALLVVAWIWSRLSLSGVGLVRETATDRAQVGQPLRERIRVRNGGRLAKLWLEVRDYSTLPGHRASRVLHVSGRSSAAWDVETECARRGRFRIGPLAIRSGDPFGLFPTRLTVPESHELIVYPATVDVSGFAFPPGTLAGGSATERRNPFVTQSVAGIREYVTGDAYNRISWPATARAGRLMIKEFDLDPTADVWLVLDLERQAHRAAVRRREGDDNGAGARPAPVPWLDSTEEYAVTIVASLARRCLETGRKVGVIATGAHHEVIVADRSDRQGIKILETLAVVRSDGDRPLAETLLAEARRFNRQSTVIVVTPSVDEAWVSALVALTGRRVRASVILVEPESFAPAPSALMVVGRLIASGIATTLVKHGDEIGAALTATPGSAAAGRARYA